MKTSFPLHRILVAYIAFQFPYVYASDGSGSHGGDPIESRFSEARYIASSLVSSLDDNALNKIDDLDVAAWLRTNKVALSQDVKLSQHQWITHDQDTCAKTDLKPASLIYLSLPLCRAANPTLKEMEALLIHESTHHLGIVDENLANKIGSAVLAVGRIGINSGIQVSCDLTYKIKGDTKVKNLTVTGESNTTQNQNLAFIYARMLMGDDYQDFRVYYDGHLASIQITSDPLNFSYDQDAEVDVGKTFMLNIHPRGESYSYFQAFCRTSLQPSSWSLPER